MIYYINKQYKNTINQPQHTYAKAGKYIVKAKGQMYGLKNRTLGTGTIKAVDNITTTLVKIGSEMGVKDMSYAFYKCSSLQSIYEGALDGCIKVTDFNYAFQNCSGLTSLPAGMFDKCTEITDFYDFTEDDIKLIDYKHHETIKMPVSV